MLALIDKELEKLEGMGETMAEREDLEREATSLSRSLPDPGALEKIIRYETAIDRQMYQALSELKSLQVACLGCGTFERRLMIGMEEEC